MRLSTANSDIMISPRRRVRTGQPRQRIEAVALARRETGGTGETGDWRHWRDGGTGVLVIGASGTGEMGGRGVSASVYRMGALEPRARQASDAFVYEFGLDA